MGVTGYPYDDCDGSDESFDRLIGDQIKQEQARKNDPIEWALPRVALLIGPGYDDEQVRWICQTALRNPGVPVVFSGHGGKEQITRIDGPGSRWGAEPGWEITGAS